MTDDLIAWLRAQLDDDEQVARAVEGLRKPYYFDFIDDAARPFVELVVDPDRVLRRVAADRRILDGYEEALAESDSDPNDPTRSADASTLEWVVRLLALPYADRPGYRDEWRP